MGQCSPFWWRHRSGLRLWKNDSIDINLAVFVPCANGGVGELVDLNGPLHILTTFTINGNKVSGKTHFQPQGISGVGLDSGDKYQATGVTQDYFKGAFNNGQFNQTFVNNFRIIGQGPGTTSWYTRTFISPSMQMVR